MLRLGCSHHPNGGLLTHFIEELGFEPGVRGLGAQGPNPLTRPFLVGVGVLLGKGLGAHWEMELTSGPTARMTKAGKTRAVTAPPSSPQNNAVRLADGGSTEVGGGERCSQLLTLGPESHHEPVSAYGTLHLNMLCHFCYHLPGGHGELILEHLNSLAEFSDLGRDAR